MLRMPNSLRWEGDAGHYEVYYLTLTDPATGVGVWIRYTMLAPLADRPEGVSCALWFLAMDPRPDRRSTLARRATFAMQEMHAQAEPFELRIGPGSLGEGGMSGTIEDVAWDLHWTPCGEFYEHVHPLLRIARVANTILVLPHADLSIDGTITIAGERFAVLGARGGQAHLWGSKHADSWAWVHCNDFRTLDGEPVPGTFVDAVSVMTSRLGRPVGPSTPLVARIDGEDLISTSPLRVISNASSFTLTGWRFEAVSGSRKLIGEIDADRDQLAGVTYHDPDGEEAYCYNSETASMRLHVYERARRVGGWSHRNTLTAPGRAHFEYGQRAPIPDLQLLTR